VVGRRRWWRESRRRLRWLPKNFLAGLRRGWRAGEGVGAECGKRERRTAREAVRLRICAVCEVGGGEVRRRCLSRKRGLS
jgi:hypothetical protein